MQQKRKFKGFTEIDVNDEKYEIVVKLYCITVMHNCQSSVDVRVKDPRGTSESQLGSHLCKQLPQSMHPFLFQMATRPHTQHGRQPFYSCVDEVSCSTVNKMLLLQQYLKGNASKCIEAYTAVQGRLE